LIGAPDVARREIDLCGQVQIKSELLSAELADAAGAIRSGEKVIIVVVEGLRLKVDRESKLKPQQGA